jgi:competence protein ComEC
VLHAPLHFPYLKNESSCVLRIETAHSAALLTGDIGEVVERTLLRDRPGDVRVRVLTVAHHGSLSSSDPDFVAATGAAAALVSAGHDNRFRHPADEVVARWRSARAQVPVTAEAGALHVRLGPQLMLQTRRATHPRLWDAVRRRAEAAPRRR